MARLNRSAFITSAILGLAAAANAAHTELDKEAIESFLRTARIVHHEALPIGVTHSQRVTLSDGSRTMKAVWKTIDDSRPVKYFARGLPELGFSDTYKNEVAAYELDKLLELDLVPPTVERKVGRQRGSLQLWVEDCITEADRFKRKLQPVDSEAWQRQKYMIRLFRQLIYDTDWENASNVVLDGDFRAWSVDHSRAFRTQKTLLNGAYLHRFSRALLERLEALDAEALEQELGPLLSGSKRRALLARRDLILARAAELVAERGEEAVLYP